MGPLFKKAWVGGPIGAKLEISIGSKSVRGGGPVGAKQSILSGSDGNTSLFAWGTWTLYPSINGPISISINHLISLSRNGPPHNTSRRQPKRQNLIPGRRGPFRTRTHICLRTLKCTDWRSGHTSIEFRMTARSRWLVMRYPFIIYHEYAMAPWCLISRTQS